jgi:dihydrofolate synthase/folylpolyglutamate synthase
MTFKTALRLLEARQECRIELGLQRLRRCLRRLGDPQNATPCIHVAGTNGKGSTCAILESVLRAGGFRTGLYLSPHLRDMGERIQIGGRPIARLDFARHLGRVLRSEAPEKLTYFELLTATAFLAFREAGVEVAVLETGLGGRLDATNVVRRPLASIITSIDLDHVQWLGPTLRSVAKEKAGIIKPRVPVFCPRLPAAAGKVVSGRARRLRAPLTIARSWRIASARWRQNAQLVSDGRRRDTLRLLGSAQGANVGLVKAALSGLEGRLPVSRSAWRTGLRQVRLPGRFEVRACGPRTAIIDGAHNPQAMGELAKTLAASPWRRRRVRWIIGLMRDKDVSGVIGRVAPWLEDVVTVTPPNPRALSAQDLAAEIARQAPGACVRACPDAAAALRGWRRDGEAPSVAVICGSFYLAGLAAGVLGGPHA